MLILQQKVFFFSRKCVFPVIPNAQNIFLTGSLSLSQLAFVPYLSFTKAVIPKRKFYLLPLGTNWVKNPTHICWEYLIKCNLCIGKQPVFQEKLFHSKVLIINMGKGVWGGKETHFSGSQGMGPLVGLWFICGKWSETVSAVVTHSYRRW